MSEQLTRSLTQLSERGRPRGADAVLGNARRKVGATPSRRPPSRAFRPAFTLAAVVLVTVAGLVTLQLLRSDPASIDEPTPVTTAQPTTTVTTDTDTDTDGMVVGAADDVADVALAPDGRLWAATAAGVVVWDVESAAPTVFSEADGLGGRSVDRVAVAADGTAWAIGDSWLAHYDGSWTLLGDDVVDADLLTPVGDMAVGPDGAVWIAAGGPDALIRVDTGGATTYQLPDAAGLETPWAWSIAVDGAGTVWASTGESGLLAFDGSWRHVGVDEGLPSDIVGNVAVAADGSVWVGGYGLYGEPGPGVPAGGIARYDGTTWTTFTTADGLLSDSGEVATGPGSAIWVIHEDRALPENGLSRYDGSAWVAYPGGDAGRGGGVVTADGTLWTASDDGIVGFDGTTTRLLVAGAEAVAPPAPPGSPVEFEPVLDPVRLSTSIGEVEFTTWVHPDGDEPPSPMTGTAHGVVGGLGPDGAMAWSVDGITWTEIPFAADPNGWSDQSATDTDDLVVWSVDDGVVRARWDGGAWVDAEFHHDPRLDGATDTVVGPYGIVVVRGAVIYTWDGTGFTAASRPPDASLHPGSSPACAGRGLGWSAIEELGPVVATDDGFIALTARNEDDWHSFPVCEPIVWFSPDGDTWTPTSDESPLGAGAVVRDIAVAGDRMVAVGESDDAAVWVSDDGATWDRADLDAAPVLKVAGSDPGWIAAGRGNTMWFSPDGRAWDGPYERPPGWAETWSVVGVAMLDDRVIGVGELRGVATEQSAASGLVIGVFVEE